MVERGQVVCEILLLSPIKRWSRPCGFPRYRNGGTGRSGDREVQERTVHIQHTSFLQLTCSERMLNANAKVSKANHAVLARLSRPSLH